MRSQSPCMWHSRKHSPLEPGVSARRWIDRLRLHAGKYILGITAPTGTGVQARFLKCREHGDALWSCVDDIVTVKTCWGRQDSAARRPRAGRYCEDFNSGVGARGRQLALLLSVLVLDAFDLDHVCNHLQTMS